VEDRGAVRLIGELKFKPFVGGFMIVLVERLQVGVEITFPQTVNKNHM
jgi:hypothetical protein